MSDGNHPLKKHILNQFNVNEADLKRLCHEMGVKSLAVFGSVTQGGFKAGQSDIDFLVEFEAVSIDRFFDFLDGLKSRCARFANQALIKSPPRFPFF